MKRKAKPPAQSPNTMPPERLAPILDYLRQHAQTWDDAREAVAIRICHAFAETTLGNGIGILEADCIDDYLNETDPEYRRCRAQDEREHWENVLFQGHLENSLPRFNPFFRHQLYGRRRQTLRPALLPALDVAKPRLFRPRNPVLRPCQRLPHQQSAAQPRPAARPIRRHRLPRRKRNRRLLHLLQQPVGQSTRPPHPSPARFRGSLKHRSNPPFLPKPPP